MKATRSTVYAVIDEERSFHVKQGQFLAAKWGTAYQPLKPVAEWLIDILGYARDAVHEASHTPGSPNVLHYTRKLAAKCIGCLEDNGIVPRTDLRETYTLGPTKRELVYNAIDVERDYQDNLGPERTDNRPHSVYAYLVMFDSYLRKAIDGWTNNAGDKVALDNIRKLAAICVRCLEDHGAPHRAG